MPSISTTQTHYGNRHSYDWYPPDNVTESDARVAEKSVAVTRTSSTTPGYHEKVSRGEWLPPQPYTYTRTITGYPVGTVSTTKINYRSGPVRVTNYIGCLHGTGRTYDGAYYALPASVKNSVDARARTKVLLQMKDMKVNMAQMYAERKQMADLFSKTAKTLVSAARNIKKGNLPGAARDLGITAPSKGAIRRHRKQSKLNPDKAVANAWLAMQYGWLPLIQDVHGLAEIVAQKAGGFQYVRAVATATAEETSLSENAQSSTVKRSKYSVKYTIHFSVSEGAHTPAQMGLTNPALVAWELVPFSFVADWFLPIGNWLSSMDATVGLNFTSGCVTTVDEQTLLTKGGKSITTKTATDYTVEVNSWGVESRKVTVRRGVLTSFPAIAAPRLKNPISAHHAMNAMALIRQTFK